jgi:hypothetical protein
MLNKLLTAVVCTSSVLSSLYVAAISPSFPYGSEKVRGVNLGGWLVLEVLKFFLFCLYCLYNKFLTKYIFFSLGSHRPFLTTPETLELSMNILLVNTKTITQLSTP